MWFQPIGFQERDNSANQISLARNSVQEGYFWSGPGAYRGVQGRGGVTIDTGKRKKLERFGDFFEAF